jgi:hypothetical protein
MTAMKTRWLVLWVLAVSVGCSGVASLGNGLAAQRRSADAGSDGGAGAGGAGVDGSAGTANGEQRDCTPPAWPEGLARDGVLEFTPAEIWLGYVQGWDRVQGGYLTLYVKSKDAGVLSGALMLGSGQPEFTAEPQANMLPIEGYVYSVLNGVIEGERWRFDVSYQDPQRSWCETQDVYPFGGGFNCIPSWPGHTDGTGDFIFEDPDGGPDIVMDDTAAGACNYFACECNACACTANTTRGVQFDLRYSADQITGAFVDSMGTYNVLLERVIE